MKREGSAGEQRKREWGRKQWRKQVEMTQCSTMDCLEKRGEERRVWRKNRQTEKALGLTLSISVSSFQSILILCACVYVSMCKCV